jgi:hypothetical protein
MDKVLTFIQSAETQATLQRATDNKQNVHIKFLFPKWVSDLDPICNTSDLQHRLTELEESILLTLKSFSIHEDISDNPCYDRDYNIACIPVYYQQRTTSFTQNIFLECIIEKTD